MKKAVTIYDIAKESGVSVSTVSRVLNNNPNVSAKTQNTVRAVIEKNHFSPSTLAQAMSKNQTRMLGVITPDISNPYFSELFLEIQRTALDNNYSILLCNTLFGGSSHGIHSPFTEAQYFTMLIGHGVDGVILTGGEIDKEHISAPYLTALNRLAANIPVLRIGPRIAGCDCFFLDRNLSSGFPALVRHLFGLGSRRIGFIGGEPGVRQTTARLNAYRETIEGLGLNYEPSLTALSNYYVGDGYRAMRQLLDSDAPVPDAVVAINDAVAIGGIRAINDQNLNCPRDIAVVSGDQFFESAYLTPRLTSLDQQNDYLGRLAVMTLISAINGVNEPMAFVHNPKLHVRESCGAELRRASAAYPKG